ncbi:MAG: Sensor protein [uncultured bacterium]|nr:MAG: Sensor protein [uncultured bacterium]HLD44019.1 HAMP domain-containing sensor histidine kinase [bacterium]
MPPKKTKQPPRNTRKSTRVLLSPATPNTIDALNQRLREALNKLQESEQKLLNTNIELQRLDRLKDDFISTVSHELRTPLSIIIEVASSLHDNILGPLNEKQARIVDILFGNANRLGHLINNLLDISQLESERIKPRRMPLNVRELIEVTYHSFSKIANKQGIELEMKIGKKLPELRADSDMLTQVLHNLVSNALRFANTRITIEVKQNSDNMQFTITDDGKGIETEELHKLFNKFEQIARPVGGDGYKGTGLGLAICKKIVELHDGQITCHCEPNKGCTFSFQLPIKNHQPSQTR